MINLSQRKIHWKRKAVLQRRIGPTERLLVDELEYDGTVEGATNYFKSRPQAEQDQIEVFVDGGVIEVWTRTQCSDRKNFVRWELGLICRSKISGCQSRPRFRGSLLACGEQIPNLCGVLKR